MKKIFLLLLVTSQLMSFKFDHKTAFGLGGACLLATGYFTYSAYGEQKKFDKDKAIHEKNKRIWNEKAEKVKKERGYQSKNFGKLYEKGKTLGVWSRRIVVYTTKKQKAGGKAYGTSITQARPNNGGSASRDTK